MLKPRYLTLILSFLILSTSYAGKKSDSQITDAVLENFSCEEKDVATKIKEHSEKLKGLLDRVGNSENCQQLKKQLQANQMAVPEQLGSLVEQYQNRSNRIMNLSKQAMVKYDALAQKAEGNLKQSYLDRAGKEMVRMQEYQLELDEQMIKESLNKPTNLFNKLMSINEGIEDIIQHDSSQYQCLNSTQTNDLVSNSVDMGIEISSLFLGSTFTLPAQMAGSLLNQMFNMADKIKASREQKKDAQAASYFSYGIVCALKSVNEQACLTHKMAVLSPEETEASTCAKCSSELNQSLEDLGSIRAHKGNLTAIVGFTNDINKTYNPNKGDGSDSKENEMLADMVKLRSQALSSIQYLQQAEAQQRNMADYITDNIDGEVTKEMQQTNNNIMISSYMEGIKDLSYMTNSNRRKNLYPNIDKNFSNFFPDEFNLGPNSFLSFIFDDDRTIQSLSKQITNFANKSKNPKYKLDGIEAFHAIRDQQPQSEIVKSIEKAILAQTLRRNPSTHPPIHARFSAAFAKYEIDNSDLPSGVSRGTESTIIDTYTDKHAEKFQDFITFLNQQSGNSGNYSANEIRNEVSKVSYPREDELSGDVFEKKTFVRNLFMTHRDREDSLGQAILYLNSLERQALKQVKTDFDKDLSISDQVYVLRAINNQTAKDLFTHNGTVGDVLILARSNKKTLKRESSYKFDFARALQEKFKPSIEKALDSITDQIDSISSPTEKENKTDLLKDICFNAVLYGDKKKPYKKCKGLSITVDGKKLTYKQYIALDENGQMCAMHTK